MSESAPLQRWRHWIGLVLGPTLALLVLYLPLGSLSVSAHRLAAVMALVVVFWLTEVIPIPVTALLGATFCIVLGIAPASKVLTAFGDPVVFLFIGSFILAEAMEIHGLDRRIAYAFLGHPWVAVSTRRTLWMLGLTAWTISMWVSNTATVAMLFPATWAIARTTSEMYGPCPRYTTAILLFLAYAASIGGMATPVGTPPNLIGIALIKEGLGAPVGFFQWMTWGMPIAVVLLIASFAVVILLFPPEIRHSPKNKAWVAQAHAKLGPWTAGQCWSLAAFLLAVVLWVAPGVLALILGTHHPWVKSYESHLPEGVIAILAASLLFILPVNWKKRQFVLSWEKAVQIDWGTILLFGGGIALGRMMFETGLASALGEQLLTVFGVHGRSGLVLMSTTAATLISETASNTASVNMIVPVAISLAQHLSFSSAVTLAVAATFGSSMGFMLPVSTPPNAIVYGSGSIRLIDMVKTGILIDIIGVAVIWASSFFWNTNF